MIKTLFYITRAGLIKIVEIRRGRPQFHTGKYAVPGETWSEYHHY